MNPYYHSSTGTNSTGTGRTGTGSTGTTNTVIPRLWKDTTVGELKVWIGVLLYMCVVSLPSVVDYWSKFDTEQPCIKLFTMSLVLFQQIKRFLHVSPPGKLAASEWWHKLEPISSKVQQQFKECYLPSSNIAIDKIMVKCEGRSTHTLTMKGKPIDKGYKLFALADY